MPLPNDLKDYRADEGLGAFQLIEEGAAGLILIWLVAALCIFAPVMK